MRTAYLTHPACLRHQPGAHHPESPQRLHAIQDALIEAGLMTLLRHYDAPAVSREALLRVHTAAYLDGLEGRVPLDEGLVHLDPDTPAGPGTLAAAAHAAGAVVRAVELVLGDEVDEAFCAVRPPGHHAGPARAMGFCLYNNVAVGAAHALVAYGLERVAILDFDVHHGNGTEAIFRTDERVLFCSSYQHPFYPYSPTEGVRPGLVHTPLPAGAYGEEFQAAVSDKWLPALEEFRPQLLLVSAGFDGHFEDDMASLNLLDSDYYWVTRELVRVAERHCRGRIVSVLEGGYMPTALGRSVVQHLRALMKLGPDVKR